MQLSIFWKVAGVLQCSLCRLSSKDGQVEVNPSHKWARGVCCKSEGR